MRVTMEPLMYEYGVDIFYNGKRRFSYHGCDLTAAIAQWAIHQTCLPAYMFPERAFHCNLPSSLCPSRSRAFVRAHQPGVQLCEQPVWDCVHHYW